MENTTILFGFESLEKYNEAREWDEATQRIKFYGNEIPKKFLTESVKHTDTHIYWASTEYTVRFNKKLFCTKNNTCGATYDRATNKLKVWFGKQFYNLPSIFQQSLFMETGCEWAADMGWGLKNVITNTMINRILNKKITNPRDLVKAYLKTTDLRNKDVSTERFYRVFQSLNDTPRNHILKMYHTVNPNHYLEVMEKNMEKQQYYAISDNITDDLYQQAIMLDEKVNIYWSEKRKHEVHAEWTRRLMEEEIKNFENVDYGYPVETLPKHPYLRLITDKLELFGEGKVMNHCVYTNYNGSVENKDYFVFSYSSKDERGTVGVVKYGDRFKINQFYGRRNSEMSAVGRTIVENYLKRDDVQEWLGLVQNNPVVEI